MFKRIITFFVLLSFLTTSQMSLVHAFEMQKMVDNTEVHTMKMAEHSAFCETKENTSNKKTPECLKDSSQDTLVPAKQSIWKEIKTQIEKILTFSEITRYQWDEFKGFSNSPPTAPPKYQDRQSYAALIGIIKRLD